VIALVFFVDRSRFGRHLDSLRENEPLARSLGLNASLYKIAAFAFSGAIAGVGGALYMYQSVSIAPSLFTGFATIIFPLMVILGGSRVVWGPPLGAFVLTFLPYWLDLGPTGTQYAYGIALILFMTFLPEGIGPGVLRLLKAVVARVTGRPSAPLPLPPDTVAAEPSSESQPKETTIP
jgi:ABC-type branched-subunit amino acid transport system permease subunit